MGNLIQYIRKNKTPTGIVIATGKNKIGWSLLNKKDKWNKHIGLEIAKGRANKNVLWFNSYGADLSAEENPRLFKDLLPALVKMEQRAKKYFKD